MSYILDALKRSEEERLKAQAPTFLSVHSGSHFLEKKEKNFYFLGFSILALAGAVIAATLLIKQKPESTIEPAITKESSLSIDASVPDQKNPAKNEISTKTNLPLVEYALLPENVRLKLPIIEISFHAYAYDPLMRGVIINKKRLKEGEYVSPGLLLKEITAQGVILSTDSYRFVVSALEP